MRNHNAPGPEFVALCGHRSDNSSDFGETSPDTTCKSCKAVMRALASEARKEREASLPKRIADAFAASSIPCASSPPMLDASVWPATCKGGERRCHECVLCEWERDAERWSSVSMWTPTSKVKKPAGAPKWPSLNAAIVALCEWERHGRVAPSASGGILACIERGYMEGGSNKSGDPLLERAGELVRVRLALQAAYPDNDHWGLTSGQCMAVLAARTPGAFAEMPTYESMSERLLVSVGGLKAVVKRGRMVVTVELAARGLIPMPSKESGLFEGIEALRGRMAAHV